MPSAVETITFQQGQFIAIKRDGKTVACLEYDWVKDADDMLRADEGQPPLGGEVLYVSNVCVDIDDPSLIWELRKQLPKAKWIVGLTRDWEFKAPKGVPEWFWRS